MKIQKTLLLNRAFRFVVLIALVTAAGIAVGSAVSRDTKEAPVAGTPKEILPKDTGRSSETVGVAVVNPKGTPAPSQEASVEPASSRAKVVLNVQGMSCSGCVANIKGGLAGLRGIGEVLVDVSSGKAQIYYDSKALPDVTRIAKAVTASGYPASVLKVQSADEIQKAEAIGIEKAQFYIASVGGWDITRAEFNTEIEAAKTRYSKTYGDTVFGTREGELLVARLKAQVTDNLISEGIMMQEVQKTNFQVAPDVVSREFDAYLKRQGRSEEAFIGILEENGYELDYFLRKFENKVRINRYLNERVLAAASNQFEKQRSYSNWYNNAKSLAEVVYYDKDLERMVQQQSSRGACGGGSSACGGSCGGSR